MKDFQRERNFFRLRFFVKAQNFLKIFMLLRNVTDF